MHMSLLQGSEFHTALDEEIAALHIPILIREGGDILFRIVKSVLLIPVVDIIYIIQQVGNADIETEGGFLFWPVDSP